MATTRSALPVLVGLIMGGAFLFASRLPREVPDLSLPSTGTSYGYYKDPCAGRERCVMFYVAPWCPACHSALGFFKALDNELEGHPRIGFKLIVGRDTESAIRDMAFKIPLNVYMDIDRKMSVAFGSSVPHWLVADSERRILAHGGGAPGDTRPEVIRMFLEQNLGLGEFLEST